MKQPRFIGICLLFVLGAQGVALAQSVAEGPRGAGRGPRAGRGLVPVDEANAQQTQQRLQEMLQQYPPSLRTVLALDPTLLTNDAYLEPYPQLATFIAQHPDIAHNPSYYFQQQLDYLNRRNNDAWNDPRIQAIRAVDQAFAGLAALVAGLTVLYTIAWVIRAVIEHRKWLRMSKTHIETHAKLMDRLTSNEDLVAYMQSTAGRKFLEAAPIPIDSGRRTLNAPFSRILWSVQAGMVVAALGGGLIFASTRVSGSDIYSAGAVPLLVIGIAAMAIGLGFFVSALFAYGLSSKLGLFSAPADSGTGQAS